MILLVRSDKELDSAEMIEMYRYMLLARRFDERLIDLYRKRKGLTEVPHSHIGQEAVGVGACYKLRKGDYILPSLRTRPALLMRVPAKEIMAGMFAKRSGLTKGKVTTHHVGDNELGIIGTTGVVGGHITIATGVAIACKLRKEKSAVLCFFGDGASNRGDFHTALNFAAVKKLPIVFIVENNQYGEWTPISSSIAIDNIADRAISYGIQGMVVDGNDVTAVHEAVQNAIRRARKGNGPTLLECKTYRFRPHEEAIQEERRPREEIEKWIENDPLKRLKEQLVEKNVLTKEIIQRLENEIQEEIDKAVSFAEDSAYPESEEALRDVYGKKVVFEEPLKRKRVAREITMGKALNEALREEMMRDESVILLGEDIGADAVGPLGGPWPPTRGLCEEFPERVIGTPISETVIVGSATGAALVGMRPVAEIMFADFLAIAMDQIVNSAAKMRYNYGGKAFVPLVIRAPFGAGISMGLHHSQSPEAWFLNVPGLKLVMPSTPYDAKGLLKTSIRDDDPVIFFEHKLLYGNKGGVPEEQYTIPLGKADIKREGDDVTIVATGLMIHNALSAARRLQRERDVSAEILDPRTLLPLDKDSIIGSVKKTGRLVIVHEAPVFGGFGGEVAAVVADEALAYLDAPIKRVGAPFAPVPFSPPLEKFYIVDEEKIFSTVLSVM